MKKSKNQSEDRAITKSRNRYLSNQKKRTKGKEDNKNKEKSGYTRYITKEKSIPEFGEHSSCGEHSPLESNTFNTEAARSESNDFDNGDPQLDHTIGGNGQSKKNASYQKKYNAHEEHTSYVEQEEAGFEEKQPEKDRNKHRKNSSNRFTRNRQEREFMKRLSPKQRRQFKKIPKREREKFFEQAEQGGEAAKSKQGKEDNKNRKSSKNHTLNVIDKAYEALAISALLSKQEEEKQEEERTVDRMTILYVTQKMTSGIGRFSKETASLEVQILKSIGKLLLLFLPFWLVLTSSTVVTTAIIVGLIAFWANPVSVFYEGNVPTWFDSNIHDYITEKVETFWAEINDEIEQAETEYDDVLALVNGYEWTEIDNVLDIQTAYFATYDTYTYTDADFNYGEIFKSTLINGMEEEPQYMRMMRVNETNTANADMLVDQMLSVTKTEETYEEQSDEEEKVRLIINVEVHFYGCYELSEQLDERQQQNAELYLEAAGIAFEPVSLDENTRNTILGIVKELRKDGQDDPASIISSALEAVGTPVTTDSDYGLDSEEVYTPPEFLKGLLDEVRSVTLPAQYDNILNYLKATATVDKEPNDKNKFQAGDILFYSSYKNATRENITEVYIYVSDGYGFTADTSAGQVVYKAIPTDMPVYLVKL